MTPKWRRTTQWVGIVRYVRNTGVASRASSSRASYKVRSSPRRNSSRAARRTLRTQATSPYGDTTHTFPSRMTGTTGVACGSPVTRPVTVRRRMNAGARPRSNPRVSLAFTQRQEARGPVYTAGCAHWGVPTGCSSKLRRTEGFSSVQRTSASGSPRGAGPRASVLSAAKWTYSSAVRVEDRRRMGLE